MDSYANQTTSIDGLEAYFLELRKNQRIGKAYSATKAGDEGKTPPIRQRTSAFQIQNPDLPLKKKERRERRG